MKKSDKEHYYPVRDANDPKKVTLEQISEEVYREIYPEIWRVWKRMRKQKQCKCSIKTLWACDGICTDCQYCIHSNLISFIEDIFILDTVLSPEDIAIDRVSLAEIYQQLTELDREICELIPYYSERQVATILGISRSKLKRRLVKIKNILKSGPLGPFFSSR